MMRAAITLFFGIGMIPVLGGCVQDTGALNTSARGFAGQLGYKVQGVTCMDMDSDGDGYVSCTVALEGGAAPIAVECASAYSIKSGCRMQRPGGSFWGGRQ